MQAFAYLNEITERRRHPRDDLSTVLANAVRCTTPVNHFSRTATVDTELRGQRTRAGDSLALFYASANRDELARTERIELDGPAEWPHASFVGGPKRMPTRYRFTPRQS